MAMALTAPLVTTLPSCAMPLGITIKVPGLKSFAPPGRLRSAIRHGFDHAMYLPELDEIRLPWPGRFTSGEAYCATLLHELVQHWTGHPSRLHRQFGTRFGDAAYAFEYILVREMLPDSAPLRSSDE